MRVFDVEELPTHGGSLRIFTCLDKAPHDETPAPKALIERERAAGLFDASGYQGFADKVIRVKCDALAFLIEQRRAGKKVCGYGAAAKGNTFLNYCGIGPELMQAVADKNPVKQGTLLPGSRIPVVSPEAVLAMKPDVLMILPWNLTKEISDEMAAIREWGGCFATAIPSLKTSA
jgi:C-methyltransferase C-terminal domain